MGGQDVGRLERRVGGEQWREWREGKEGDPECPRKLNGSGGVVVVRAVFP